MLNRFLILSFIWILSFGTCLPAGKVCHSAVFRDMPEKYWAESAVYNLVKLGVTEGYPDGTFRGKKQVTRFEIAGFLNKLAEKIQAEPGLDKIVSELKTEFNAEKFKRINPDHPLLSGILKADFLLSQENGNNLASNYRAVLNLERRFNKDHYIKMTLDTLDAGFNSTASRNPLNDMFEFEGDFKLSDIKSSFSFGPGDTLHSDAVMPISSGEVFRKNKPEIKGEFRQGDAVFSAGYTALNKNVNGVVTSQDFWGGLSYTYFSAAAHYTAGNQKDVRGEIKIKAGPLEINAGIAGRDKSGLYLGAELKLNNLKLSARRAGSRFRTAGLNKYDFLPLNAFNKYILDGTCDLALEFTRPLSQNMSFNLKADYVLAGNYNFGADYPGTSLTTEYDLALKLNQNSAGRVFYRHFYVPSGINYADSAVASSVPSHSSVIGLGLEAEL